MFNLIQSRPANVFIFNEGYTVNRIRKMVFEDQCGNLRYKIISTDCRLIVFINYCHQLLLLIITLFLT